MAMLSLFFIAVGIAYDQTTRNSKLDSKRDRMRFMAMIPVGEEGEPRPDLLVKRRTRTVFNRENHLESRWDMPYHQ